MSEILEVFKGTDKDMKCHNDFQYELGKTVTDDDAIRCGNKGFHSCEAPFDVLRYFGLRNGNRFFRAEAGGKIDRMGANDSKLASSELTLRAEIGLPGLIKAQVAFTRKKAQSGEQSGYDSNLAGGDDSNLAGGNRSNLAGGDYSNLAGGYDSNLAGGNDSNLAGGDDSNLAGGDDSNLAGGYDSNLAGGDRSNLAGGNRSNLAGGEKSLILGGHGSKAKGGLHSVIVLTEWGFVDDDYRPVCVKAEIVDGEKLKADTWYQLKDGEFVAAEEEP